MIIYLLMGLIIGLMEVYYGAVYLEHKVKGNKKAFCITVFIVTLLNILFWPITVIEIIIKFILYIKNL